MANWITSFAPGGSRGDALAWAGHKFTIGGASITVTHLGRWVLAGTTGFSHTVKLVNATTGIDVSGGSVTIDTTAAPTAAFKYVALAAPISLTSGQAYYLVNNEPDAGETWLNYNSVMSVTSVASPNGAVYNASSSGGTWVLGGSAGDNYVGLDFTYSTGVDTTPPTVVSRVVVGSTLTVTYDETLNSSSVPAISAFTVLVNGVARAVTNVTVSGTQVVLTLASPVTAGQTVTLSYNP